MKRHDPAFMAIKPRGKEGDWKCDGYSPATQTVFQCYGPELLRKKTLFAKIDDDFDGAKKNWSGRLKRWVFVYAQTDSLYADVAAHIATLVSVNPSLTIEAWNSTKLWDEVVSKFPEDVRNALFGTVAITEHIEETTGLSQGISGLQTTIIETGAKQEARSEQLHAMMSELKSSIARLPMLNVEPVSTIPTALQSRFEQRFEKCRDKLIRGSIKKAEEDFAELIADLSALNDSRNSDLLFRSYLNYSTCLTEQLRFDNASTALESARVIAPNDQRLKRHTLSLLAHRGDYTAAFILSRELREAEPDERKHIYNEAGLLFSTGRLDELVALLQAHPFEDVDYFCYVAHAALRQSRYIDAQNAARRACELEPKHEAPWIALAYSLGFPAIERRQTETATALSIEPGEEAQVREALSVAERALEILLARDRPQLRAELLTNVVAFHAVLNEDEEGLKIAAELFKQGERSEMLLQNLYYLQMRTDRSRDALLTAQAMAVSGQDEKARLRLAQAAAASGNAPLALEEWEKTIASVPAGEIHADWIEVACRALASAHQHERALNLLDEMLGFHPSSVDLLLERAKILEELGKVNEAHEAHKKAEIADPASAQVAVDFGMFLYRRQEWRSALEHLTKLNAAAGASPLHLKYLTCLYNSGERTACAKLVLDWRDTGRGFDETVYALGARCAILGDDFPLAREFLKELLHKGSDRGNEHRKMLGKTYLRLDELEEAYDLLTRAAADTPSDAEVYALLGHVCTARGRHAEAIKRTQTAVELAPDDPQVRAAFVSAMFALPEDFKPDADSIKANQRNIDELANRWPHILKKVETEPNLKSIRKILRKNERQVRRIFELVDAQPMPFGFIASQTATPSYAAWVSCCRDSKRGIRMCIGSVEAQAEQLALANRGGPIAVDLLSLFTLQRLGLLSLLASTRPIIYAHISLLDTVVAQLRQLRDHTRGGRMGTMNGQFFFIEDDPAQRTEAIAFLSGIRDFLKRSPVQLVGLEYSAIQDERLIQFIKACGEAFVLPIFVAAERQAPLLSDDLVIRSIGAAAVQIKGFCSQALLRSSRDNASIANDQYQDAAMRLLEVNYHFVADETRTLIRAFGRSPRTPEPVAMLLIERINNPSCHAQAALAVVSGFTRYLWEIPSVGSLGCFRDAWATAVWRAVLAKDEPPDRVSLFVFFLGMHFLTRPAKFVNAIIWAIRHVPEAAQLRRELIGMALGCCSVFAEGTSETYVWPECQNEWNNQHSTLKRMIRMKII